jgi:hypothetical protein
MPSWYGKRLASSVIAVAWRKTRRPPETVERIPAQAMEIITNITELQQVGGRMNSAHPLNQGKSLFIQAN